MLCLAPPVYLALAGQPSQAHWPGGQVQATPTPWQLKIMVSNWLLEFKTILGISPLSSTLLHSPPPNIPGALLV